MEARHIGIGIDRDWRSVYDRFRSPEAFGLWAAGLSQCSLRQDGERWHADGPGGPVTIRFTADNAFGVMDHWVTLADGGVVHVPMRVLANGSDAEVVLTLYRQPGMDDAAFAHDAGLVTADLARLKALAER